MGLEGRKTVRQRLRTLERNLVAERTELGVQLAVSRLVRCWDQGLPRSRQAPDAVNLLDDLADTGFYIPTTVTAIKYLEQCRQRNSLPDPTRLLQMLLPSRRQA